MVYLRKYVDSEWLEGDIDGSVGIFPISYVNIVVDCVDTSITNDVTAVNDNDNPSGTMIQEQSKTINLTIGTFHKVIWITCK